LVTALKSKKLPRRVPANLFRLKLVAPHLFFNDCGIFFRL